MDLGEIFQAYLETNSFGWKTISNIAVAATETPITHNVHFVHGEKPYFSEVWVVNTSIGLTINVKLFIDGLIFDRIFTNTRVSRHNDKNWCRLPPKIAANQSLLDLFPNYSPKIWYNEFIKKVDVQLFAPKGQLHFLIEFEQGCPDEDARIYHEYKQQCTRK
jgi:hypothetical protein